MQKANENEHKASGTSYASLLTAEETATLARALYADRALYRFALEIVDWQKRCLGLDSEGLLPSHDTRRV